MMAVGATVILEPAGVDKQKRTRKTHHKVRTGCQTCKIRRKKCDEAKPFCKRCTSTGRKCDGYESLQAAPSDATSGAATGKQGYSESQQGRQQRQQQQQQQYQQQTTFYQQQAPITDPNSPDSGIDVASTRGGSISTSSTTNDYTKAITTGHQLTLFTSPSSSTSTSSPSQSSSNSHSTTPPTIPLSLHRPPSTTYFSTPTDFYSFDFFRHRTGPEFAAYFDSSIWRSFLLRACFLYPSVLQAATAVGAVHRRFELGISPEAFQWCAVAERGYKKAMACLRRETMGGGSGGAAAAAGGVGRKKRGIAPEVEMLSHMLLSIFETFQGNYDSALRHMTKGLTRLLRRETKTVHRETRYKCVQVGYGALHELTDRLESLCTRYFGGSEGKHIQLTDPAIDEAPTPVPSVFGSLEEARDLLMTEGVWVYRAWEDLSMGKVGMGETGKPFEAQHRHIARLLSWSVAYAEFSKTDAFREQGAGWMRRAAQLLKTYREALYLVLLTQMAFHSPEDGKEIVPICFPPETCDCHRSCRDYAERKSALNAHLARILVLCEALWEGEDGAGGSQVWGYEEHSISVDSGIGPPVLMGQAKCRSTKVRHQVTGLLSGTELREQVWGKLGVYSVAEKLSSIEEHAVVAAAGARKGRKTGHGSADFLNDLGSWNDHGAAFDGRGSFGQDGLGEEDEDWFRGQPNWWIGKQGYGEPKWVDVTCFIEEGKLLVRHCREDELGGLIWTQEWATFV